MLIGRSGPQFNVVINHSIRKALWKIVPGGGVDGMVYANHVEYSFLCSSPSWPLPVTIHFWSLMFWYLSLVPLPGLREPSVDIPMPAFLRTTYKQRSKPFWWHRRIESPSIFPPLDMERKITFGAKAMAEHQGVAFCSLLRFVCLLFVNFSAKLYSSYLNISSPTSLRQSVNRNRSWSHSCWLFFFFAQL